MSPSQEMTLAIFTATYIALAAGHLFSFKINRPAIALLGAILMVGLKQITPHETLLSVNFPTLITLYGLMIVSGQLWLSGFYTWVAKKIALGLNYPAKFLLILMSASALLSAFLINDVVCLAFTPVVTASVMKKKLNPVPFLLGIALAANIGAAMTPIGNPQNILVASEANLHFGNYLLWCAPPVFLSLLVAYFLVWVMGKKEWKAPLKTSLQDVDFPPVDRGETMKGLMILLAVVLLFFTKLDRAIVMISGAGVLLLSRRISSTDLLQKVDYSILTLFTGLFIVVGALTVTPLPAQFLHFLQSMGINLENPYLLAPVTALMSDSMSNAAAVMLLVKTLPLENSTLAYVLCLANSFAGNLIIIGSIANIIVVEQAKTYGAEISFRKFAQYGLPVTVSTFLILLLWIWMRGATP